MGKWKWVMPHGICLTHDTAALEMATRFHLFGSGFRRILLQPSRACEGTTRLLPLRCCSAPLSPTLPL